MIFLDAFKIFGAGFTCGFFVCFGIIIALVHWGNRK